MYYIVETSKSFDQATTDLDAAIQNHSFGILHIHDLAATLRKKGMAFDEQCKIFEVCNPGHAVDVLATDMRLNMALPCRISIWTEKGQTKIGLIKPKEMLSASSQDAKLLAIATEVEAQTIAMIDEAK